MKDTEMIAAIRHRDEAAMADCLKRYSRLLWPIASAVLKNAGCEQDVEECVADAFIYLWQHPDQFNPARGSLKSWLCIVVRSRAIDRYRQILRHSTVPLEEAVLTDSLGLQDALLQAETRQALLAAVAALGQPCRDILVRRYYYNQKPREIALAMDLSVKQVDNALYRAKRQLRQVLAVE